MILWRVAFMNQHGNQRNGKSRTSRETWAAIAARWRTRVIEEPHHWEWENLEKLPMSRTYMHSADGRMSKKRAHVCNVSRSTERHFKLESEKSAQLRILFLRYLQAAKVCDIVGNRHPKSYSIRKNEQVQGDSEIIFITSTHFFTMRNDPVWLLVISGVRSKFHKACFSNALHMRSNHNYSQVLRFGRGKFAL